MKGWENAMESANKSRKPLSQLSDAELIALQYRAERHYAGQIRACKPFSDERKQITHQAYREIDALMRERHARSPEAEHELTYGAGESHFALLVQVAEHLRRKKERLQFFEAGIGRGYIIQRMAALPFLSVSGCDPYVDQPEELAPFHVRQKPVYDALLSLSDGSIDLFYWNDVMEHIPEDEIIATCALIKQKLSPHGLLVTCTPNRYRGPHDITRLADPGQKTAKGLHLKEYSLSEVMQIYRKAELRAGGAVFFNRLTRSNKVLFRFASLWCRLRVILEFCAHRLPLPARIRSSIRFYICDDFSIARR